MPLVKVKELECKQCASQSFALAHDIDGRWLIRCTRCGRITDMPSGDGAANIIWSGNKDATPKQ